MSTELLPQTARRPASPQDSPRPAAGAGPYTLAFRRLRRDHVSLAFGAVFLVITAMCLAAPLYAHHIAHTGPADNHVTDTIQVGGQTRDVEVPMTARLSGGVITVQGSIPILFADYGIQKAMQLASVKARLAELGVDAMDMPSAAFDALVKKEIVTSAALAKAAGLKPN